MNVLSECPLSPMCHLFVDFAATAMNYDFLSVDCYKCFFAI